MDPAALPYVLFAGFFFGSSLIATRFGIIQFEPATFTGLRLLAASLGFFSVYAFDRRRHPWPADGSIWRHGLLLGIVGVIIPFFGSVLALQHLSSGAVAMFITVGPAMTVLLAHFLLPGESLTPRRAGGVALALSGALLLALRGETGLPDVDLSAPTGYLLLTSTMLAVSFSTIYVRKYMARYESFDVTSTQMIVAAAVGVPLILALTGMDVTGVDWRGYLALLYSAMAGTFLGILAFNFCIKQYGATTAAMTQYVVPIVATIGGILLLGERVTAGMLIGIGLIVAGITLIQR